MDFLYSFFGESAAFEADGIHSICVSATLGGRFRKRQYVAGYGCAAADKGMGTDAHEVMDGAQGADCRPIFHGYVAAQRGRIRHDDVVADLAVMRDVGVSHDEVVIAESGATTPFRCSPIDGNELSNLVVIADFKASGFTRVANILRSQTDRSELVEAVVRADFGFAFDHHVRDQMAACAKFYIGSDDAIGADFARGMDPATWIGDCRGMEGHCDICDL